MLISCDNKGCMKQSNAQFSDATKEVICTECRRPILNISETMKRVLKSSGQVIREDNRQAFMMACRNCNANRTVALSKDNETVCSVCKEKVNVHPAMKQAIVAAGVKVKGN